MVCADIALIFIVVKIYELFAKIDKLASGCVIFDTSLGINEPSVCTKCAEAKHYTCLGFNSIPKY